LPSGLIRHALPILENLRRFGHTVALGGVVAGQCELSVPCSARYRGIAWAGAHRPASGNDEWDRHRAVCPSSTIRMSARCTRAREIPMFPEGIEQLLMKLAEVRKLGFARVHVADARDHHVVAVSTGDPRSCRRCNVRLDSRSGDLRRWLRRCALPRRRLAGRNAITRSKSPPKKVRVSARFGGRLLHCCLPRQCLNYVDRQTLSISGVPGSKGSRDR